MLHERKIASGYGDSVVKRLSADLKERYPKWVFHHVNFGT